MHNIGCSRGVLESKLRKKKSHCKMFLIFCAEIVCLLDTGFKSAESVVHSL